LIGITSARCSRRISAQSSTFNTRFLLTSNHEVTIRQGVDIRPPLQGQFSRAVDSPRADAKEQTGGTVEAPVVV